MASFSRKRALGQSGVKTATVVNFPDGGTNAQRVGDETADAVAKGADEVDLVLPYKAFLAGDIQTVVDVIEATRMACGPMTTMKVRMRRNARFTVPPPIVIFTLSRWL